MKQVKKPDRALRVGLFFVSVLACAAMFRHPGWLAGSYDWRYFESAMEAARRSVAWFGELPLYNPYMCGGEPQLANPQSVAGSPAFVLIALFGTAVGEKLMLLLFVALGLDGGFCLARALGVDRPGSICAALVFGLSGWVMTHFGIGHVSFFGATLIPHALYAYLRGREDLRWSILLGALAALIVAQGGTSTAAMAAIALGTVAVVDAIAERTLRPFVVLVLGAMAAIALGAYRLLPALEFAIDHPRRVTESDAQSPWELVRAAFLWSGSGKLPGHRYGFHEYAWRVSYLAWPLCLFGFSYKGVRRRALALVLVGAGIAMGDFIPHGPWALMRHLPVLRDLRVPSRYALLCALGVALLAGAGAGWLLGKLSGRREQLAATMLLVALAVEGIVYGNVSLGKIFDLPPPKIDRLEPYYQVKGHYSRMLDLVYTNRGVIGCDEEAPLTRALALDEGPVSQVRLEDPGAGELGAIGVSPDRYVFTVRLARPATVLINLNWNEHWHASAGEVVRHGAKWPADKDGGRLAVALPAMSGEVSLRYRPRSFVVGAALSLISLAASMLALVAWRRGRRRSATLVR